MSSAVFTADFRLPSRRPDLVTGEQYFEGNTTYLIKDASALKYFRFRAAEFRLFCLLDGKRTVEEVQEIFSREFAPRQISSEELQKLISMWQHEGLLLEDGHSTANRILSSDRQRRQSRWYVLLSNALYIKMRAFDPDRLLTRIYPWVSWVFQPVGVFAACSLVVAALALVLSRLDQFTSRPELQNFYAFFNASNLVWFWLAVAVVKILHEFGHGLTCKHFGGECHDMGLLLMVFTPCLYCNVTDAWMMPNKWHRIAIAAAGIYVEVVIAALATFIWWSTAPGIVHNIAFSAMLFGSVQTILINANPLLKYDGYYVMSDWLEVPNLRARSYRLMKSSLSRWFWGETSRGKENKSDHGLLFIVYAVAATLYGTFITVAIVWFLMSFLKPYKLTVVGWSLAAVAATNSLALPAVRGVQTMWRRRKHFRTFNPIRPVLSCLVLGGLVAAILFAPFPRTIYSVLTIEPEKAVIISAPIQAQIQKIHVSPGQFVKRDEPLLDLESLELAFSIEQLEKQRTILSEAMRAAAALHDVGLEQQLRKVLDEATAVVEHQKERLVDLHLKAPADGWVVPEIGGTPLVPEVVADGQPLPQWQGSLLDRQNLGATIITGTPICRIATSVTREAVLVISQQEVEALQIGQQAAIKLDAFPGVTFQGVVREISLGDVKEVPEQLLNSAGSELPAASAAPGGSATLVTTHYRVRVQLTGTTDGMLESWEPKLKVGLRGRTWIRAGSQTAAEFTWRWFCRVFVLS